MHESAVAGSMADHMPHHSTTVMASQCNMIPIYDDSRNAACDLLSTGRPDGNVTHTVQSTLGGVPIGDPDLRGHNDTIAWQKWVEWSGYRLEGKTRSEITQEFLQGANGSIPHI